MIKRQPLAYNILIKVDGKVLEPGKLIQSKGLTVSRRMFNEAIYELVKDETGAIFMYLGNARVHDNLYDILLLDQNGNKLSMEFGLFEIGDVGTIDVGSYFAILDKQ